MNSTRPSRRQLLFSFFAGLLACFGWRPLAARQAPSVAKKLRLPAQGVVQGYSVTFDAHAETTVIDLPDPPLNPCFREELAAPDEGPETVILTLSAGSYVITPTPESFSLTMTN